MTEERSCDGSSTCPATVHVHGCYSDVPCTHRRTEERFRPDPEMVAAMLVLIDDYNNDLASAHRIDPKVREDLAHFLVLRGAMAL